MRVPPRDRPTDSDNGFKANEWVASQGESRVSLVRSDMFIEEGQNQSWAFHSVRSDMSIDSEGRVFTLTPEE